MNIQNNFSLKKYNSYNVDTVAKYFVSIEDETQLEELINEYDFNYDKYFILGNGTNVLFSSDFYDGLVIKNNIKHTLKLDLTNENIIISASTGIDYDFLLKQYFEFLINNNLKVFGGLENLSQIPTSVGAAVIQNVGAYSIEQSDFFHNCNAICLLTGMAKSFSKNECNFDYRDSFFKQNKNYFITKVQYKISLTNKMPTTDYDDINRIDTEDITPEKIYNIIATIRKNKIPSCVDFPNCGSFFKNPIISQTVFDKIIKQYPDTVYYRKGNKIKLSAASLIESCGLKGFRVGDVGISDKHSLFIVNYGNAAGYDIVSFSKIIVNKIFDMYGVILIPEVVMV